MKLIMFLLAFYAMCAFSSTAFSPTADLIAKNSKNVHIVLVAGSNGYYNYRHQADICHAYQVVYEHGVPNENIIVMMYDDIAYNPSNPVQGNIINQPNGSNVYVGVSKDYTGKAVTPQNFLAILSGNASAIECPENESEGRCSKKVLKTTDQDYVFVYFADHGGPGILAFPHWKMLYAHDLMDTLEFMHTANRYKEMVIYVEACESGSMFNRILPDNWKIYATTAANPYQSSYGCYCQNDRETCLGDWYSVHWMQNADVANFSVETIHDQFVIDRNETTTSHVCEYGDKSVSRDLLQTFMGSKSARYSTSPNNLGRLVRYDDVKMDYFYNRYLATHSEQDLSNLMLVLAEKTLTNLVFGNDANHTQSIDVKKSDHCYSAEIIDSKCLQNVLESTTLPFMNRKVLWSIYNSYCI